MTNSRHFHRDNNEVSLVKLFRLSKRDSNLRPLGRDSSVVLIRPGGLCYKTHNGHNLWSYDRKTFFCVRKHLSDHICREMTVPTKK